MRSIPLTLLSLMLAACGGGSGSTGEDAVAGAGTGTLTGTQSTASPEVSSQGCQPTEAEQAMLEAVNAARSQARQCGDTSHTATQLLTFSCELRDAALAHTQDMRDNNFFDHMGSDGLQVSDRVTAQGYRWRSVGENIAAGYPDVQAVMTGWLNSPGHCRNIMSPAFTQMGSAMLPGDGANDYATYWTQVFAQPR